jgi:hypothetical protein
VIGPEWVRGAADAYAERLLASSEVMERHSVPAEKTKSAPEAQFSGVAEAFRSSKFLVCGTRPRCVHCGGDS